MAIEPVLTEAERAFIKYAIEAWQRGSFAVFHRVTDEIDWAQFIKKISGKKETTLSGRPYYGLGD